MEALDKLEARKALRLSPNILKPVEAHTFEEAKRLVNELDPRRNPTQVALPISTDMSVTENNKNVIYRVEATTKSKSKRDILIEGLNIIKQRLAVVGTITDSQEAVDVNGREMRPATLGYSAEGTSWVDALIRQWLGAHRDGIVICWDLADGYTYRYDIYTHRLSRIS